MTHPYRSIISILLLGGTLLSCGTVTAQEVKKIDNEQLVKLLEEEEVQLVDVRTPTEVERGRIEGAVHIDYLQGDFSEKMRRLDKTRPVIVYCAVGGRSANAAAKLKNMGFDKIYDLTGGVKQWVAEGRPLVK